MQNGRDGERGRRRSRDALMALRYNGLSIVHVSLSANGDPNF